ncbi:hypothetical protein [Paenibacillus pabuli]|uniref:hypothetical protein n=1 Tax=Paenibacillus pabuli TaxID=1472 RepID=UPI003CED356B
MDKKAAKILLGTFWGSGGWKTASLPFSGDDFEYAKSKGVMFDPLTITHDEIIARLHEIHQDNAIKQRVVSAFLHSLSTKKVYLRSALSSWALTSQLPLHTYEERRALHANTSSCGDCNFLHLQSDKTYTDVDLNVLNFERVKWGGVRHNNLLYCLMDLDLLLANKEAVYEVTDADIAILVSMLEAAQTCEPHESARGLEKRWKGLFPSSKQERDAILEIWGASGLLVPQDTPRKSRGGYSDFHFAATWQGDDGYSADSAISIFGSYLPQTLSP